jgi:hypothetical protein
MFTRGLKPNGAMLTYYALHDYAYRKDFPHVISRKRADQLLLEYGRYAGYPKCKRNAVYAGVWLGGWRSWKKYNATFYVPKTK